MHLHFHKKTKKKKQYITTKQLESHEIAYRLESQSL